MTKRALVTGITGQDGSHLAELLLDKGYEVLGMVRRTSTVNWERIGHLQDRITFVHGDLLDQVSILTILQEHRPDEVYNLAAQSFVPTSWQQPVLTGEFTAIGVTRMLDAIRIVDPDDPLLPGVVERDVRQGGRDAPAGVDALLPAVALRRGQGLRPLDHGQLPRVLRPARHQRHPVQPRGPPPGPRVRRPGRSPTPPPASSWAWPTSCAWATSTPSATGATPATTSRPCGSCSSRTRPTTT